MPTWRTPRRCCCAVGLSGVYYVGVCDLKGCVWLTMSWTGGFDSAGGMRSIEASAASRAGALHIDVEAVPDGTQAFGDRSAGVHREAVSGLPVMFLRGVDTRHGNPAVVTQLSSIPLERTEEGRVEQYKAAVLGAHTDAERRRYLNICVSSMVRFGGVLPNSIVSDNPASLSVSGVQSVACLLRNERLSVGSDAYAALVPVVVDSSSGAVVGPDMHQLSPSPLSFVSPTMCHWTAVSEETMFGLGTTDGEGVVCSLPEMAAAHICDSTGALSAFATLPTMQGIRDTFQNAVADYNTAGTEDQRVSAVMRLLQIGIGLARDARAMRIGVVLAHDAGSPEASIMLGP